jgi:ribosomal protein S27E
MQKQPEKSLPPELEAFRKLLLTDLRKELGETRQKSSSKGILAACLNEKCKWHRVVFFHEKDEVFCTHCGGKLEII